MSSNEKEMAASIVPIDESLANDRWHYNSYYLFLVMLLSKKKDYLYPLPGRPFRTQVGTNEL